MRRLVSLFVLAAAAIGLAACPPPPALPTYAEITFSHLPPIEVNVAEIRIEVPYQEPLAAPHVGESFPVPPTRAARRWAEDRLRAVGDRGVLVITIREAGAVETELEQAGGLTGAFTKQQAQKYEATVSMLAEATDPVGPRVGNSSVTVRRSVTVREDADINEREDTWYKLTQDVMADLNTAMEAEMRRSLASFLR